MSLVCEVEVEVLSTKGANTTQTQTRSPSQRKKTHRLLPPPLQRPRPPMERESWRESSPRRSSFLLNCCLGRPLGFHTVVNLDRSICCCNAKCGFSDPCSLDESDGGGGWELSLLRTVPIGCGWVGLNLRGEVDVVPFLFWRNPPRAVDPRRRRRSTQHASAFFSPPSVLAAPQPPTNAPIAT